jgi:hypothetical protein
MIKNVPPVLAAIDKKRNRIFVLAIPNICAVKMDGVWHLSQPIPMEEIDEFYDLITDLRVVQSIVDEAKAELRII